MFACGDRRPTRSAVTRSSRCYTDDLCRILQLATLRRMERVCALRRRRGDWQFRTLTTPRKKHGAVDHQHQKNFSRPRKRDLPNGNMRCPDTRKAAIEGWPPHRTGSDELRRRAPEPLVGFEPTTARLRIECSTPELQWQPASNMPWRGFEPRRLSAPPPQDGVSTSFTTRATNCRSSVARLTVSPHASR